MMEAQKILILWICVIKTFSSQWSLYAFQKYLMGQPKPFIPGNNAFFFIFQEISLGADSLLYVSLYCISPNLYVFILLFHPFITWYNVVIPAMINDAGWQYWWTFDHKGYHQVYIFINLLVKNRGTKHALVSIKTMVLVEYEITMVFII